jgi:hypothetical protein
MNLINKFLQLTFQEKKFFLLALTLSLGVKIMIFMIPIRYYSKFLPKPILLSNSDPEVIRNLSIAISRCNRHTPWETKCLVEAITAKFLLYLYGVNSTIYFGVSKGKDENLIAHAWLKCGNTIIAGKKGHERFTIVSSFA